MEYWVLTLFIVVVVMVFFYGQISLYLNRYKNLKALKVSSEKSQKAKIFYMAYMGVYQTGDQPSIQVLLKGIEFKPAIESSESEYMNINVSPLAVKNLSLESERLKFSAKFNGKIIQLTVPLDDIVVVSGQSGIGFKSD